ncbi:MAG: YbaB/EbfC family nucleoid-associated protein [Clostridiales Family XIII bacterium]|jgi:DNA-binding YbaB/EbfC family protein|nr:YbaB/EbfC family nucleoid-associated protein [Clostridiales Family XIII bacterium]
MGKGMRAGKKPGNPNKTFTPKGGGGGGQADQIRRLQAMQKRMDEVQAEIEEKEVDATVGGGAVKVKVNGKKELVSIEISPDALDPDDAEMLQDLIVVAVNEGLRQIEEISKNEMEKLTGGLSVPGLM